MSSNKSNQDTLVIINPKAASGNNENNIDIFSTILKKQIGEKIKIIITKNQVMLLSILDNTLRKTLKKL